LTNRRYYDTLKEFAVFLFIENEEKDMKLYSLRSGILFLQKAEEDARRLAESSDKDLSAIGKIFIKRTRSILDKRIGQQRELELAVVNKVTYTSASAAWDKIEALEEKER
jgi:hypothetical protein